MEKGVTVNLSDLDRDDFDAKFGQPQAGPELATEIERLIETGRLPHPGDVGERTFRSLVLSALLGISSERARGRSPAGSREVSVRSVEDTVRGAEGPDGSLELSQPLADAGRRLIKTGVLYKQASWPGMEQWTS
jgi:hypothetical protein